MTDFRTIEISNPDYAPDKTKFVTVQSPSLGRRGDIVIYNGDVEAQYVPAIILLHGVYGSAWSWLYAGGVHKVYERLRTETNICEFVLVMPSDGLVGDGSGYLNRLDARYEDWIVRDAIAAAMATAPAFQQSSSIYIAGLSMGGYGAIRLGARHPEVFSGISAHSPITKGQDFNLFTEAPPHIDLANAQEEIDLIKVLEARASKVPPLRFDCGKADPLIQSNLDLTSQLKCAGIDNTFECLNGGHDWSYWTTQIVRSFSFFSQVESQYGM